MSRCSGIACEGIHDLSESGGTGQGIDILALSTFELATHDPYGDQAENEQCQRRGFRDSRQSRHVDIIELPNRWIVIASKTD